jgi:hypothetical protein
MVGTLASEENVGFGKFRFQMIHDPRSMIHEDKKWIMEHGSWII